MENGIEEKEKEGSEEIEAPKIYILRMLLKNLPDKNQQSELCEEYFNLVTALIRECPQQFKINKEDVQKRSDSLSKEAIILGDGSFSAVSLLFWCIQQLNERPTYEDRYSQVTDKILAGYLQLTQSVLEINPDLKRLIGQSKSEEKEGFDLVTMIFKFLFQLPQLKD